MLTHAQPIAKQQAAAPSQLLAAGILGMIFCMEYPFGQFGSAVLAVLLSGFLCTFLLAEHGTLRSP